MTTEMLKKVHEQMMEEIHLSGGYIHEIYFCPDLAINDPVCRKPNPGMAFAAKAEFPEIEFRKSIMIGDSFSDMKFGKDLGMKTIWIENNLEEHTPELNSIVDIRTDSLLSFAYELLKLD